MGTIAGDDTVLLILRDGSNSVIVLPELGKFIEGIEQKRI
jgi:arginine repressor